MSGVFLVAVATAVFTNGWAAISLIVALALAGALLGDQAGFYAGRWLGPRFHHSSLARRHRDRISRAENLVRKYGAIAIFIGRFIPAIRSLIPAVLGLSGFDRLRYLVFDLLACLLWSLALGAIVLGLNLGFSAG